MPREDDLPSNAPVLRAAWFQRVHNIGDAVSPLILGDVTRRQSCLARSPDQSHVLAIGSLLGTATAQSYVWGTGLLHPDFGFGAAAADRVLALRGKLSHAELRRAGVAIRDVPLGDPGFLIGRLFDVKRAPPRFQLGLVPHYVDRQHPFFVAAARQDGVKVLDVCDPPEVFFRDFAACATIASTSLHGLIFAEALGLSNCWLEVSDRILGQGFKFADWFSLAANPQAAPFRPGKWESIRDIADRCEPREVTIDTSALAGALTDDVIAECSEDRPSGTTFVSVARCRARPLPVFITLHDDLAAVERAIAMCRRQTRAVEIICYDDGDTVPEVRHALPRLERDGVTLLRREPSASPGLLAGLSQAIGAFFGDWCEPSRYAITDGAPGPWNDDPQALATYDRVLDIVLPVNSAGPLLAGDPAVDEAATFDVATTLSIDRDNGPGSQSQRCVQLSKPFDGGFALFRAGQPLLTPTNRLAIIESDPLAHTGA